MKICPTTIKSTATVQNASWNIRAPFKHRRNTNVKSCATQQKKKNRRYLATHGKSKHSLQSKTSPTPFSFKYYFWRSSSSNTTTWRAPCHYQTHQKDAHCTKGNLWAMYRTNRTNQDERQTDKHKTTRGHHVKQDIYETQDLATDAGKQPGKPGKGKQQEQTWLLFRIPTLCSLGEDFGILQRVKNLQCKGAQEVFDGGLTLLWWPGGSKLTDLVEV